MLNFVFIVLYCCLLCGRHETDGFLLDFIPIMFCFSANQAKDIAAKMINSKIITKQTGEAGTVCLKVMVSERLYLRREYYFAIALDRSASVSIMEFLFNSSLNLLSYGTPLILCF